MTIPMKPVSSSNIKAIGYDPEMQILAIQFGSGSVYHYQGVPEEIYDDLQKCQTSKNNSIGHFFARHIKGAFEYERQPDEKKDSDTGAQA